MTKSQIQNPNQSSKSKYLNYLSFKYSFVIWILSFVICGHAISLADDEQSKFPFIGKPNRDDVNIRAGNNQNFEILTKVNTDDLLFAAEQSYGWYRVRLPKSAHCYVAKDFIDEKNKEAVSKVSNLNVRARPNKESSVVGQLKKGDAVTILAEEADGWYEILPPSGSYGWVRSQSLEFYSYDEKVMETIQVEQNVPLRKWKAEDIKPVEKPKKKRGFLWW